MLTSKEGLSISQLQHNLKRILGDYDKFLDQIASAILKYDKIIEFIFTNTKILKTKVLNDVEKSVIKFCDTAKMI